MKKIKSTGFWQLINNPARWDIQSFLKNKEKETLDSNETPKRNPYCENCAYLEQGAKL